MGSSGQDFNQGINNLERRVANRGYAGYAENYDGVEYQKGQFLSIFIWRLLPFPSLLPCA
jgi:hypothetical protein